MIEGTGFLKDNPMELVITNIHTGETSTKMIYGATSEERQRKGFQEVRELNKRRFSELLCRWLRHRQHKLEKYEPARAKRAGELLVLMHLQSQFHWFQFCREVARYRPRFEELAPTKLPSEVDYYQKEVLEAVKVCCAVSGINDK